MLIEEIVIDLDDQAHEAVLPIQGIGGRPTAARVARRRAGGYPGDRSPSAVEVIRRLGGRWPDRELAVTMNRMRGKTPDGSTWTTVRVAARRERLGVLAFADADRPPTISADAAAHRLGIRVPCVHKLVRKGVLPATQLMPSAPWQIPLVALATEQVRIGLQDIAERRPTKALAAMDDRLLRLPGLLIRGMHDAAQSPRHPRKT